MRYEELKDTNEDLLTLLWNELFQLWRVCACVCEYNWVSSKIFTEFVGQCVDRRLPCVFMFDKKIWASFHAPSKLPIIYRASPRRVEGAPLPRSDECSHIQIALTLPESSPSQTCFWTPHCASFLQTQRVITGAPGQLSHFFFFFSANITQTLWYLKLLNFPPHVFDFISNPAIPVPSCLLIGSTLWTWEWLPSGCRLLLGLRRSVGLWWSWAWKQHGPVLPHPHGSQPHFTMCDFTPQPQKGLRSCQIHPAPAARTIASFTNNFFKRKEVFLVRTGKMIPLQNCRTALRPSIAPAAAVWRTHCRGNNNN